jgi:uncharacterized OsmC-like protein
MTLRTFQFRLHSQPTGSEPAATTLQLERLSETGEWEPLVPALSTPGFRLYLSAMLICLHYHLVAEAREQGLPLCGVEGRFSATTADNWSLTQVSGAFQLQLAQGHGATSAESVARIRERMLNCPVLRNLEASVPRSLELELVG